MYTDLKAGTNLQAGTANFIKPVDGATCKTFYQRRGVDKLIGSPISTMNMSPITFKTGTNRHAGTNFKDGTNFKTCTGLKVHTNFIAGTNV